MPTELPYVGIKGLGGALLAKLEMQKLTNMSC